MIHLRFTFFLFTLLFASLAVNAQSFTKITDQIIASDGGDSRSVNWIDFDDDGDLDLFVSNGHSPATRSFLYRNDEGTFVKITEGAIAANPARSDGASWGDFDNDGDADLFVANWYNDFNRFYENAGDGNFRWVTGGQLASSRGFSESSSWVDYDNDGYLDMFVANSGNSGPEANYLFRSNGDPGDGTGVTFTKISTGSIVTDLKTSRSINWADYDNDGDVDAFVANESNQANNLYKNLLKENGSANFESITSGSIVTDLNSTISASWADYDNDGDFDLFVANLNQNNSLYQNNGDGTFAKVTAGVAVNEGGWSFGCSWADYDNDGDLDLFVANGWGGGPQNNFLYRNLLMENGSADFEKITNSPVISDGGWSYGSSWGDYDKDGDLDLFVAKWVNSNNENNALFRNDNANGNNWLLLNLSGVASNKSAIGTKIRLAATINGNQVWQMRQISGQDSYCGQNLQVHFGLGNAAMIDSLVIEWPSGAVQKLDNVTPNAHLKIVEGVATGLNETPQGLPKEYRLYQNFPNPFNPSTTLQYALPQPGAVTLKIFDVLGQEIRTLVNEHQTAGLQTITWNGKNHNGRELPSGIYIYQLIAGSFSDSRRMMLAR